MVHASEANPRLTENTCDEPAASLMPLEDYQRSELVSLEAASEHIKSLFRTLPRDVWIAKNACKNPADGLTPDEAAAIHLYTMDIKEQPLYSVLNKLLRDRDRRKLKPWFAFLKLFLTALFKLPACSAKILWRGVTKDLHSKYHRGEHYTWWAFSSCTLSLEVLEQPMYLGTTGERTLFSIECFNAKNIRPHSYYQLEDEILLLPGFYFEVVSKIKAANDLHIIHVREVIPPYPLLEPPFVTDATPSLPSTTTAIDSILDQVYVMNKDNDDVGKLFIVLPDPVHKWDSKNLFENTFRLHFVCECPANEIHFACCPPYPVPNPHVFFQIYGQYMSQFMILLGRHLFDRRMNERYHDAQFWNAYQKDLDKIVGVLSIAQQESSRVRKMSDTSELKDLILSRSSWPYPLHRSLTADMSVRWVCMKHYPADQYNLSLELSNIQEVRFDITSGCLAFVSEIDPTKVTRVCEIFKRGLRLYQINLSNLLAISSSLQCLTDALRRAPLITILCCFYQSEKSSDSDKVRMETILRACNEIVASNSEIRHLRLSVGGLHPPRYDGAIKALQANCSLRSFGNQLQMTGTDISQLLTIFHQSQLLTTLELGHNPLSVENVQSIAGFIRSSRTLLNLILTKTGLEDDSMRMIVDAICVNPIMNKLSLWRNKLSDGSASFIVHLLRSCSSLTHLDVSFNRITLIGVRTIFEELQMNQTLLHFDIGRNDLSIDHAMKTTKYQGSLLGVSESIAKMLLKNTTLYTLRINSITISDADIGPLSDALANNRTLAYLAVSQSSVCSTLRDPISNLIPGNCSLVGLDLSDHTLNAHDMRKFDEMLQKKNQLHFLDLSSSELTDDRCSILAQTLTNNRTLTHLDLGWTELSPLSVKVLADALRINANLIYLNVDGNQIGDDGANAMALSLSTGCSLMYLSIMVNTISDMGAQCIVDALELNETLIYLAINGNQLSFTMVSKLRSIRRNLIIS